MTIAVKFFAGFREATGVGEISIPAVSNVGALLDELVGRFGEKLAGQLYHPKTKRLLETVNILVNGRGINLLKGLNTPLKNGDVVAIFPPVSGGG